jgi:transcriptional regulator with XRE-family HTH domain
MHPGTSLKELRSRLGITVREVEEQSQKIAEVQENPEFLVSNHWLTKLENTDRVPGIHKLFSLSAVYRVKISGLLCVGYPCCWCEIKGNELLLVPYVIVPAWSAFLGARS